MRFDSDGLCLWFLGLDGGRASEMEAKMSQSWDISDVDRAPGLDAQVARWMRGVQVTQEPGEKNGRSRRVLEIEAR